MVVKLRQTKRELMNAGMKERCRLISVRWSLQCHRPLNLQERASLSKYTNNLLANAANVFKPYIHRNELAFTISTRVQTRADECMSEWT